MSEISRREFLTTTAWAASAASGAVASAVLASAVEHPDRGRPPKGASLFQFAAAFPPLVEYRFPTDRWLGAIAAAGYTHCILQNDPFAHPEDLRVVDRFPTIFDMTTGSRSRSYQAWLQAISHAAERHGLALAFEAWEPVLTSEARRLLPEPWKGPATESGETLCVSHPEARAWLLQGFATVMQAAPQLNTWVLGINDGDMYVGELCNNRCPRCAGRPLAVRLGELYRDIQATCARTRPGSQIILYDWFWEDDYFPEVFSRVARGTPILTRLERGATYTPDPDHPEWSGKVYDQCLGCDATGTDFARAQELARAHDAPLYIMPSLSGMFECSQLPYVPAPGQVARKFEIMRRERVSGWVDFDCGGIHEGLMLDLVQVVQHHPRASLAEWLERLASERYGPAAPIGREAWEKFDRATRIFPAVLEFASIREYAGRFGDAIDLTVVHPFIAERAHQATDFGNTTYFFDPHNFLTREAIPPITHCLEKAVALARAGKQDFDRLIDKAQDEFLPRARRDAAMAELTLLAWQSALNFYKWGAAVQGDDSVPIEAVIRDEIATTRRYRDLQSRPELGVGNMTTSWQLELINSVPELATRLFDWRTSESTGTGDLFEAKLEDLERQARNWTAVVRRNVHDP